MHIECLEDGAEVVVAQSHYFSYHLFILPIAFVGEIFQKGVMFEQDIDTMTLYVSLFVLRYHQGVLAAGKYLAHGLEYVTVDTDLSRLFSSAIS